MTTLRKWFEGQQTPTHFRWLKVDLGWYLPSDAWEDRTYQLISWGEMPAEILDREFDEGYGSAGIPAFYAWSPDFVYCRHEYDGSTSLRVLPRNPG